LCQVYQIQQKFAHAVGSQLPQLPAEQLARPIIDGRPSAKVEYGDVIDFSDCDLQAHNAPREMFLFDARFFLNSFSRRGNLS